MKILFINQAFYPDVVATAQQLTDFCVDLARRHEVSVIAGNKGYDDASKVYPKREVYSGIKIRRISYASFGKGAWISRALNFASFHLNLAWKLLWMPRQDVVVALTSPPLVSVTAALFCTLKGSHFVYWVMDMNPDEALAAGWLRKGSILEKILSSFSRWSFKRSDKVIALDRFMKNKIVERYSADGKKIGVIPPWAHDDHIRPVEHAANSFRKQNALDGKYVVMYSGNHSPCHPLDTMLEAALHLEEDKEIVFCFVGGGSLVGKVKTFKAAHRLSNILQFPYQPIEKLSESLSAADLHVVVMGDPYVGIVHPCKIYGILSVGRPFVFIGPQESHIGDLIRELGVGSRVGHGDAAGLVAAILAARSLTVAQKQEIREKSLAFKNAKFSRIRLSAQMADFVTEIKVAS